jgi:cytoskeletal protein RodZ
MSPNSSRIKPDELLERYSQAKTQLPDGLPDSPSAATRERIMQAARENSASNTINSIALKPYSTPASGSESLKNEASNDSFWNIKAVASLAVMGLSALLWWQFEHGTPAEQEAAKSALPTSASAPAPTSAPAPATEAAPAQIDQSASAAPSKPSTRSEAPGISGTANAKDTATQASAAAKSSAESQRTTTPPPVVTSTPAEPAERPRSAELASTSEAETPVAAAAPAPLIPPAPAPAAPRPAPAAAPMARSAPNPAADPPHADVSQNYNTETASAASASNAARKSISTPPAPAVAARSAPPTAQSILLPTEPLFTAIEQRSARALRQGLSQGISPNARTASGNPALTQAVTQRWLEGVRILLAAGADRNAKNNKGHTAADVAFELGYSDMAELLAAPR